MEGGLALCSPTGDRPSAATFSNDHAKEILRGSGKGFHSNDLECPFRTAHAAVAMETAMPLAHGRLTLIGLVLLIGMRVTAYWQGNLPGGSLMRVHFLAAASDVLCILSSLWLFATGIDGRFVALEWLGPMLPLVFGAALITICSLCYYLVFATPQPLASGTPSFVKALESAMGVWEFALIASSALQSALCASSWRIYRSLRMAGLYPPGEKVVGTHDVSLLEVICDAEDVKLLSECEVTFTGRMKSPFLAVDSEEMQAAQQMKSDTAADNHPKGTKQGQQGL